MWKILTKDGIYCSYSITPHGTDEGSVEPKRYSVDFTSQYIFLSTWIALLSIFHYILLDYNPFVTSIYIYIYIYIKTM